MPVVAVVNPLKIGDTKALRARMSTAAEQYDLGELSWIETTIDDTGTAASRRAADAGATLVVACGGNADRAPMSPRTPDTGIPLGHHRPGHRKPARSQPWRPTREHPRHRHVFGGNDRKVDVSTSRSAAVNARSRW